LAGVLGTGGAVVLSWALSTYLFNIEWQPAPGLFAAGIVATGLIVAVVGVLSSLDVMRKKPLATLRSE
jgi:hypothetical protein